MKSLPLITTIASFPIRSVVLERFLLIHFKKYCRQITIQLSWQAYFLQLLSCSLTVEQNEYWLKFSRDPWPSLHK